MAMSAEHKNRRRRQVRAGVCRKQLPAPSDRAVLHLSDRKTQYSSFFAFRHRSQRSEHLFYSFTLCTRRTRRTNSNHTLGLGEHICMCDVCTLHFDIRCFIRHTKNGRFVLANRTQSWRVWQQVFGIVSPFSQETATTRITF